MLSSVLTPKYGYGSNTTRPEYTGGINSIWCIFESLSSLGLVAVPSTTVVFVESRFESCEVYANERLSCFIIVCVCQQGSSRRVRVLVEEHQKRLTRSRK